MVAGVAAFIEAHEHRPVPPFTPPGGSFRLREWAEQGVYPHAASGLSSTAYDLLRIGAWALVIFGALLVVMGLIAYWGAQRRSDARA